MDRSKPPSSSQSICAQGFLDAYPLENEEAAFLSGKTTVASVTVYDMMRHPLLVVIIEHRGAIDGVQLIKLLGGGLVGQLDLGRGIVVELKTAGEADLVLDLVGAIGMFAQERLGGLATVAELVLAIGKPGARSF